MCSSVLPVLATSWLLENGHILYKGDHEDFQSSGVMQSLAHSGAVGSTGRDREAEAVVRRDERGVALWAKTKTGVGLAPRTLAKIPQKTTHLAV